MDDEQHYYGLHRWLYGHFGPDGSALYTFFTISLALAMSGLVAYLLEQPLLMISLALTALLFFRTPLTQSASPRNTLIGHFVGMAAGVFRSRSSACSTGPAWPREASPSPTSVRAYFRPR